MMTALKCHLESPARTSEQTAGHFHAPRQLSKALSLICRCGMPVSRHFGKHRQFIDEAPFRCSAVEGR